MAEIQLGPAGNCLTASNTEDSFQKVNTLGLQAQELEFVKQVYLSKERAKALGALANKLNISISAHASYYINLCSPEKRHDSIQRILKAADRVALLRGSIVVFHPGYYQDLSKEEALSRVKKACLEMQQELDTVKLGLEVTGTKAEVGTLDETVQLCIDLSQCVPVIDFAHIYARNGGHIDYSTIFDKLEPLHLEHFHTHFANVAYTEKGEQKHLPFDHAPPFKPLATEILRRNLNITIVTETPKLEADALKMKTQFETLGYQFSTS